MRRPIRSSKSTASTARIIRPGTRSMATRPSRRPRSSSARRGPAKRRCGCRSPGTWSEYNASIPAGGCSSIHYDDFNPFLDRFRDRLASRNRRADRVLASGSCGTTWMRSCRWRVTGLVDRILDVKQPSRRSSATSTATRRSTGTRPATCCCWRPATTNRRPRPFKGRWHRLRRR